MISVTDLKNYVYCPYIVYIRKVLGIESAVTEYMKYGREVEREKAVLFLYKMFKGVKLLKNIYLRSIRYRLQGCVEYVIVDKFGYYIPVDVKWSEVGDRPRRDHVVQVCAYALLLEESLGKVKQCGLYYVTSEGGKVFRIVYSSSMRNLVLKIVKEIENMLKTGKPPDHVPDVDKCVSCPFSKVCPFKHRP